MSAADVGDAERANAWTHASPGRKRVAYLVTHPIQYQVPLLRMIAAQSDIALHVLFRSDAANGAFVDPGFGQTIAWDIPLLEGYSHEFLPYRGVSKVDEIFKTDNYGLSERLTRERYDALWVHGYAPRYHWYAMTLAKTRGIRVLLRDEAHELSARRAAAKMLAKRGFFWGLNKIVDRYLAIGTLNADYYRAHGARADQICLVPYAVDNAFFQQRAAAAAPQRGALRASLGLDPGRPIILYASKLTKRKRAGDLVAAVDRLIGASAIKPYLLIVGDGELRADLEAEVAASQTLADAVRFLGFKAQTELPAYYDLCDVFVLPAGNEPWAVVVNEAMNAGRAIIASDEVGSAVDLVQSGVNGFTFPVGDVAALTDRLARTLGDMSVCRRMGEASLKRIGEWSFAEDVDGLRAALAGL